MKKLHIFTSAACNYIPKVCMLFRSLRQHHPEAVLHLVLSDEKTPFLNLEAELFDEVRTVAELGIPEWKPWAFCHSIVELTTAIKPFYLKQLLERKDCEQVLYLDPDVVVFSRLDDLTEALRQSNILLTPQQIEPETTHAAMIENEIGSLRHGIYNLGFIGVANTPEGHRFAAWWASRLYHFCRCEIHNGLFTDQRWIDLAPAFFDGVALCKSPRHNVAIWNLTTRKLSRSSSGHYLVNGEPLGFYHFSGFDSGVYRSMAHRFTDEDSAVQTLTDWYGEQTQTLARDTFSQAPWAYGKYSDGTPIEPHHRVIYRERPDLQNAYPDPFDALNGNGFSAWITRQGPKEYPTVFHKKTIEALFARFRNLTPGFRQPQDVASIPEPKKPKNVTRILKLNKPQSSKPVVDDLTQKGIRQ